jgi:CheY-like chemotaxis protein
MEPYKILVVEDHRDTADVLVRLLRTCGYQVTLATGYIAAITLAIRDRFDLLLADICLPDGDGCDLLREIRGFYPVEGIAFSGRGMKADVDRCLHAGYHAHILKPASIQRICADIERARVAKPLHELPAAI